MISTGLGVGLFAFVTYHSLFFFLVYKHMNLCKKKKLRLRHKISRSPFNYRNSSKYMEQKEGKKKIATLSLVQFPIQLSVI